MPRRVAVVEIGQLPGKESGETIAQTGLVGDLDLLAGVDQGVQVQAVDPQQVDQAHAVAGGDAAQGLPAADDVGVSGDPNPGGVLGSGEPVLPMVEDPAFGRVGRNRYHAVALVLP